MKTVIDVSKWERYDLFRHYEEDTNPFVILTTPLDITNAYNIAKETNSSMYATLGYLITKVVNKVDGFRYRKEDNEIVVYDHINANFTENIHDGKIGFFTVKDDNSYKEFVDCFESKRNNLFEVKKNDPSIIHYDEIWMSCVPWFEFNGVIPPFNKDNSIPQFIWDKFKKEEDKVTIHLMLLVHHGFIDGYGIGKFINLLQEEINNFKGDE